MKKRLKKIVIVLIGIGFLGMVSLGFLIYLFSPHPPTDERLIKNYSSHKADYERLVKMVKEDYTKGISRVDYDWYDCSWDWENSESKKCNLEEERWEEYRELFKRIGLKRGVSIGKNSDEKFFVEFKVYSWGLVTGGLEKGVTYAEYKQKSVYASENPENEWVKYKYIEDNWYIYLENYD